MICDNLLFLILPFRIEGFGIGVEINAEELFHVRRIRSFKRGGENRPEEFFHIEMTCDAKNANWLVKRFRGDPGKMTGSAIDAERRQPAEMLDVCPTDTNRPAKFRIRDQTKMR